MLETLLCFLYVNLGLFCQSCKLGEKEKGKLNSNFTTHKPYKKSCPSSQLSETTSQQKVSFLLLLPRWSKSRVKNDPTARCKKTPLLKPGCSRSLVCCRNDFIRKEC